MKRGQFAQAALAFLDPLPQILIDDPQLRDIRDDQSGFVVRARDTLSGIGVLYIGKSIPDQPTDIQFVVQDAGAAPPIAVDCGRSPVLAGRAADVSLVERVRDRPG